MPKLDGSGPTGQGAGTGQGLGHCGGGMGRGWGCRGGFGHGRRFISPKNELLALEGEESMLLEELAVVKAEKEALKNQK